MSMAKKLTNLVKNTMLFFFYLLQTRATMEAQLHKELSESSDKNIQLQSKVKYKLLKHCMFEMRRLTIKRTVT